MRVSQTASASVAIAKKKLGRQPQQTVQMHYVMEILAVKHKNIRSNAHARLVRETIAEGNKTVEQKLYEKTGADVAVVVNFKGETVATINLNSDPFVQDLKGMKEG